MTVEKAKKIVGNQPRWEKKELVKALKMLEEAKKRRLLAGQIILKNKAV